MNNRVQRDESAHVSTPSNKLSMRLLSPAQQHKGKACRQFCYRLLFSHLLACSLAWQVGTLYSHIMRCSVTLESSTTPSESRGVVRTTFILSAPVSQHVSSTLTKLIVGMMTVEHKEFIKTFPLGAPLQGINNPNNLDPTPGSRQVLLLYQAPSSLPWKQQQQVSYNHSMSVGNATRRCKEVKHIITHLGPTNHRNELTCIAIVGQRTDSYHVNKWIRRQEVRTDPLVRSSRYEFIPEYDRFNDMIREIPNRRTTLTSLHVTTSFTSVLDKALKELQPIADKVAQAGDKKVQGTIVVMVCNSGHAEIFVNFACAARSNGVDLSKVLLFATDHQVHDLAKGLGVATFFHEKLFESIPKDAAEFYGDRQYGKIMLSKSFASYLASETGYDFIFQDVDIIPYRADYWGWWTSKKEGGYDFYFQEDFNARAEFAPWIGNSGCFLAKNNVRTRYFFASFLWQGDIILHIRGHQAAMHAMLSEHASQYGLRIYTLQEEHEMIPLGWHFHRNFEFMRRLIRNNKSETLSFHVNWNLDKSTKRKFLEQMGDWYVQEACLEEKKLDEVTLATNATTTVIAACCAVKPLVRCHFRDKPSVIPCTGSPPYEENGPSFW